MKWKRSSDGQARHNTTHSPIFPSFLRQIIYWFKKQSITTKFGSNVLFLYHRRFVRSPSSSSPSLKCRFKSRSIEISTPMWHSKSSFTFVLICFFSTSPKFFFALFIIRIVIYRSTSFNFFSLFSCHTYYTPKAHTKHANLYDINSFSNGFSVFFYLSLAPYANARAYITAQANTLTRNKSV